MKSVCENKIVKALQSESEEDPVHFLNIGRPRHRVHSEISAWGDETPGFFFKKSENTQRKLAPSHKYLLKTQNHSPVMVAKKPKIYVTTEPVQNNLPHPSIKLPMINGTKSPIYRYAQEEKTPENPKKPVSKKDASMKIVPIFTPRSIKTIKNPLQISSFFNNQILRSLSSTKKKNHYAEKLLFG